MPLSKRYLVQVAKSESQNNKIYPVQRGTKINEHILSFPKKEKQSDNDRNKSSKYCSNWGGLVDS